MKEPDRRVRDADSRSGQAVLELAVGLFALLAAVVAVLVAGFLSVADGEAMVAAQRDALEKSSSGVAAAVPADSAPPAVFPGLEGVSGSGLHRGEGEVAVVLPPAAEPLFGLGQEQVARREAWMPSAGGLQ